MDHFGIGAGVRAAVSVYMQSGRRTGRTTSLIESVKDGDRIVFSSPNEAQHVQRKCKERGVNVEIVVLSPREPQGVFQRETPKGRTIFDHGWVEQYYMDAIERAQGEIDRFQRESSGYGEAHRETRRRAEELGKWRPAPFDWNNGR